jgi:hypothetical protein
MSQSVETVLDSVVARGDLAHLALFLWASAASALAWYALKELSRSNRRFEDFVTAIARVDSLLRGRD